MASSPEHPAPDEAGFAARFRFADVEFDEGENQLRVSGRAAVVEPRPLRLLLELLRRVNEVVSKEELLNTVWEGRPTVDHVLANAVSKLRIALGENGAARLVTVPRMGYKLVGPVQRLPARAPELVLQAGRPVPGREAYLLERPLGDAHSGVWLARHAKLGQTHVFKFATDGAHLSALKREYAKYQVLMQKLGPREDVLRMLDASFQHGPLFVEYEFAGHTLGEWASPGDHLSSMPQAARLDLFVQVAGAVAAAHSVGVLHEDLGPDKISVMQAPASLAAAGEKRWLARVTGFGGAPTADGHPLDAARSAAESPAPALPGGQGSRSSLYLAPELLEGHAATMQSDVYALGLLLWQLLAGDMGRPLVTGWQREVEDELLREDILAATEVQPSKRLQSVAELQARIASLDARQVQRQNWLKQADLAEQAQAELRLHTRRRPWLFALLGAMVLGLLASLIFALKT